RAFVQKENELNLNAHISAEEREKMVGDLESFIKDKLLEITKNPLTTNLIVNVVNNFGWKEWIKDPFTFLQQFSQQMPDYIKDIFDKKSDLTKVINGYANMRFTFTIIILLFLYLWMRIFTNEFVSYVSLFAYSIFIVFSYGDFGQQEFLISVALFIAGMVLIYRKKPWWMILVLISLECFVRTDHALFIAMIYSLYNFPLNKRKLFSHGILFFIPIFATYLLAKVFFPNAIYYTLPFILEENLQDPWAIIYPTVFFVLPLFFIKKFGEYEFYKKTWLWMIPFVALNLMMGAVREIRLFLPLMAYLFPVLFTGVVSLYNTNEN
ncbi:MAG TPA: hypothetical protein VIL29_04275, partial [Pseudothermotoga sp.]